MATVTRKLAALLGAGGAGLTDSTTSSQITTTSLKDDAVTSAKIGTDQVGADALSSSAIAGAADIPANSVGESELSVDYTAQSVPHIIPGVLHPAIGGKDINGTALSSYTYGDLHVGTGVRYYYTDIKGSKPIKDPRVGSYYGGQRHLFKSMQLLEQETADHGDKVYSIDGREWIRGVGALSFVNATNGIFVRLAEVTTSFFEITGYFNAFNFLNFSSDSSRPLKVEIDGVTATTAFNPNGSVNSPLGTRYVSSGSVHNVDLTSSSSLSSDTTLGIHTIRISFVSGSNNYPTGCELIAHDTASTARRNEIKIPRQNVVSFGKKFEVGSDDLDNAVHPHYNPFDGMSGAKTLAQLGDYIDTATSLGMENWKAGTANYYKPFNGGRVVKWVASDGTIKTSVTMMPPNAQNAKGTASDAFSNAEIQAGTNNHTITFDTTTIANATPLSELTKSFHWREFGNGAANAGDGSSTFADLSMLSSADDTGFTMEDGLTSLVGDDCNRSTHQNNDRLLPAAANDFWTVTFIGTGLQWNTDNASWPGTPVVQNLPYGTHVLKVLRDADEAADVYIDGHGLTDVPYTNYACLVDYINIYQPKRPPIPEDCVVLADYMLMADFVGVSASGGGVEVISKGTRLVNCMNDCFYDENCSQNLYVNNPQLGGAAVLGGYYMGVTNLYDNPSSGGEPFAQLPYFGTTVDVKTYADRFSAITEPINSTSLTTTAVSTSGWSGRQRVTGHTLGLNGVKFAGENNKGSGANNWTFQGLEIHTPIHTSSHYQTFENLYTKELVGGDRNMEQTNLVCSPDGKTWDEITRDTSYIGNRCISTSYASDGLTTQDTHPRVHSRWRGTEAKSSAWRVQTWHNKDFAISYDRVICLVPGLYRFTYSLRFSTSVGAAGTWGIILNEADMRSADSQTATSHIFWSYHGDANEQQTLTGTYYLNRGDHISWMGPSVDRRGDTVQIDRVG